MSCVEIIVPLAEPVVGVAVLPQCLVTVDVAVVEEEDGIEACGYISLRKTLMVPHAGLTRRLVEAL